MREEVKIKYFTDKYCSVCKVSIEKEQIIHSYNRIHDEAGPLVLFRMFALDQWNLGYTKDKSSSITGGEPIVCDKCLNVVDLVFNNLIKHDLWDNEAVQNKVINGDVKTNIQLVDLDKEKLDLDLIRKLKDYL